MDNYTRSRKKFVETIRALRKKSEDMTVDEYIDYLNTAKLVAPTDRSTNYEPFKPEYWKMAKYDGRKKMFDGVNPVEYSIAYEKKLYRNCYRMPAAKIVSKYRKAFNAVKEELDRPMDNYTKLPIIGHTFIYNASPTYGHHDYNKSRLIAIAGNEKFINWLFAYVEKKTGIKQPRL